VPAIAASATISRLELAASSWLLRTVFAAWATRSTKPSSPTAALRRGVRDGVLEALADSRDGAGSDSSEARAKVELPQRVVDMAEQAAEAARHAQRRAAAAEQRACEAKRSWQRRTERWVSCSCTRSENTVLILRCFCGWRRAVDKELIMQARAVARPDLARSEAHRHGSFQTSASSERRAVELNLELAVRASEAGARASATELQVSRLEQDLSQANQKLHTLRRRAAESLGAAKEAFGARRCLAAWHCVSAAALAAGPAASCQSIPVLAVVLG
jgi:hypothetical protein